MRRSSLVLGLLLAGCSSGPSGNADAGPQYAHQALPVHCRAGAPLFRLELLSKSPEVVLGSYGPFLGATVSNVQASLLSTDRGEHLELVTADYTPGGFGPPVQSSLPAVTCTYVASGSFWATHTQPMGSNEANSIFNVSDHEFLMLTGVVDGHGQQLRGSTAKVTIGGVVFDYVWRFDADHWMLRSADWMWASSDGGKTVTRLRPVCFRQQRGTLTSEAWVGDSIWFQNLADGLDTFYRRDGNGPLVSVLPEDLPKWAAPNRRLATWRDRLLALDGNRIFVADETFKNWQLLDGIDDKPLNQMTVSTDDQGNLWAIWPGPPLRLLRYAPGTTTPTLIDFDFAPKQGELLSAIQVAADGTLLFSVRFAPDRSYHQWATCEAGPGIPQKIDAVEVEPLDAVNSGRVVRVARLQEGSELLDKLSVAPSGAMFGGGNGLVLAHAVGTPPLYRTPPFEQPEFLDAGVSPYAVHGADDETVATIRHNGSSLTVGPFTNELVLDAHSGAQLKETRIPVTREVDDVVEAPGLTFHRTSARKQYLANWRVPLDPNNPEVPEWTLFATNGVHAAFVGHLDPDRNDSDPGVAYTYRLPAAKGRFDNPCVGFDGGPPAGCIEQPPLTAIAAQLDALGNLYVLDRREARVLRLAADSGTFVEVARGFVTPSDLRLRPLGDGGTVVLVYDGDVWAFVPEPGTVKRPEAGGAPLSKNAYAPGARDVHDCLLDGPCITDARVDLKSASGCAAGRGFGATQGAVGLGAEDATVTSWSDTKVCFTVAATTEDGLLAVRRADAVASNEVPFVGDGRVESWELPADVYADTVLAVVGKNLGRSPLLTTLPGATVLERTPSRLTFRLQGHGVQTLVLSKRGVVLATRTITMKARVDQSCRAGASDFCTVRGLGFGYGSTTPGSLATLGYRARVDGQSATLQWWLPTAVSFLWPAGMTPGIHDLELVEGNGSGAITTAKVELLAPSQTRLILGAGGPTSIGVSFAQGRPVPTPYGLLTPIYKWQDGNARVGPMLYSAFAVADQKLVSTADRPDGPSLAASGGVNLFERGNNFQIAAHGNSLFALGAAPGRGAARLVRLDPPDGGPFSFWITPSLGDIGGPAGTINRPAGLGEVEGRLVASVASGLSNVTWLRELDVDGGTLAAAPTVVARSFVMGSGDPQTVGTYFTPHGVYLASCHDPGANAEVLYLAAALDGGALSFAAPEPVFSGPKSLTACNTTADGLLFVRGDTSSEVILKHRPDAGLEVVATVPATLPGARQRQTYSANVEVPGLVDLAELPGGDLVVLLNDSVNSPRGLRLARYAVGTQTWTVSSEVVAPGTLAQPGEVCIGPVTSATECEGWARSGCAPYSCDMPVFEVFERPTTRIGEAELVVLSATEARVIYEATETKPLPAAFFQGTQVHAVTLPIP